MNDIKYTPDFAYTPISSNNLLNVIEEKQKNVIDLSLVHI